MRLGLYWRYATRQLVRGGQRTVLAVFCVAVGVLAIVALQLVTLSVNAALLSNIVEANGGDIHLRTIDLLPLHASDLAIFDQLKAQGRITDYDTAFDVGGDITLSDGTDAQFDVLAVSPNYPLVGQPQFAQPSANATMQGSVHGTTVAVSNDIYDTLHAHIGDQFLMKTRDGRSLTVTIGGEFRESGSFATGTLVMSAATLNALPGPNGQPLATTYSGVHANAPASLVEPVAQQLQKAFPNTRVITAQDLLRQRQQQVSQLRLFLHLVGLLALFIGGVGIINTMQVILRRRTVEIAMLKTSGYRQRDLYGLFGVEAALLGTIGGVLGAAAGVGASYIVRAVVDRAFFLHLPTILDAETIISGVVIGLATALIFGLLPIVQGSQIRPLAVLRENAEGQRATSRIANLTLLFLLTLLFIALASVILEGVVPAILAVYGGLIAVGALGLCLGALIWGIARLPVYERPRPRMLLWLIGGLGVVLSSGIALALLSGVGALAVRRFGTVGIAALVLLGGLGIILVGCAVVYLLATLADALVMFAPRGWKTVIMLAYRNIGRQRVRTTTTLVALFVGIFGIGMVVVLGQGIKDTIDATIASAVKYNCFLIAPPLQAQSAQSALAQVPGFDPTSAVESTVGRIKPSQVGNLSGTALINELRHTDDLDTLSTIEGFNLTQGLPVQTIAVGHNLTAADAGTNHAVVADYLHNAPYNVQVGDTITITSDDGSVTQPLTIIGFYSTRSLTGNPNFGSVITDEGVATKLAGIARLTVYSLHISPTVLPRLRQAVNASAPQTIVFSLVDLTVLVDQVLSNIIIMMSTLASLAMFAGLVIIANAVALAMLERRREIGILKSVGHTSGSVMATVLVENGLIGLLGGLIAMLLVVGAISALGAFALNITLLVSPLLIAGIIAAAVLVVMLVAALVAWGATRVRPLEVLRYE
jgi:putative ABC transport system permease protein